MPDTPRAERRLVTALFVDVCGFTSLSEQLDPELVMGMLHLLFRRVDAIVRRYDGTVDKFIGDAAMVLFGAPTAHEDDPERAVRAALDMLAALPEIDAEVRRALGVDRPLALHAGVATGPVVTGLLGAGPAAGYSALGDAVNVASRLADLAGPGEILVGPETAARVEGRIRLEPRGAQPLSGKRAPVPVFAALSWIGGAPVPRGLPSSRFVGRDAALTALIEALRGRDGQVVTVVGPAGVGKSRLVREAIAGTGAPTLTGRCISYETHSPLHLWADVAASLLAEPAVLEVLRAADAADGGAGSRCVALSELAAHGVASGARPAPRPRGEVQAALRDALEAAAPRVILLEDLHWSDEASLELLAAMVPLAAARSLTFLCVHRDGLAPELALGLARAVAVRPGLHLSVGPLDPVSAGQLLDALLAPTRALPEEVHERLLARADGFPLALEELVGLLCARGALRWDGEAWRWDGSEGASLWAALPGTLRSLLASRVDRLGLADRERLELASAIGVAFDPTWVDALRGASPEAWARLEAAGLIVSDADPGTGRPRRRFVRALLQEVVYEGMLGARRAGLHGELATWIAANPDLRARWLHALGAHLERSGQPREAALVWQDAGDRARVLGAAREALALYDRALEGDPSGAIRLAARRAYLLGDTGRAREGAALLDEAIASPGAAAEPRALANMLLARVYMAYYLGDGEGALRTARRALEAWTALGDPGGLAAAWRQLGIALEFLSRYAEAREAYARCLALAEVTPDTERLPASVYNSLGEICRVEGRYEEALRHYERSQALRMAQDERGALVVGNVNRAGALLGLGRTDEALALLDTALAVSRKLGVVSLLPEAMSLRAVALARSGRRDEAWQEALEAREIAHHANQEEMGGVLDRILGLLVLEQRPEEAWASLNASVGRLHATGKRAEEAQSRLAMARVYDHRGHTAEALAEREAARGLLLDCGLTARAARVAQAAKHDCYLPMAE